MQTVDSLIENWQGGDRRSVIRQFEVWETESPAWQYEYEPSDD